MVIVFNDERTLLDVKKHICHCYRLTKVNDFDNSFSPQKSKVSDVMDDFSLPLEHSHHDNDLCASQFPTNCFDCTQISNKEKTNN